MVRIKFPKRLRLLTPSHFSFVFQQPQRSSISYITILGRLNSLEHPRIGLAITKKNIKFSHERNRIKRLTRESFRLRQHKLLPMDFVVVAKKGVVNLNNQNILEILENLWYYYYRLAYKF